jgi:transcriptional regulator with XRE-family HTH domain
MPASPEDLRVLAVWLRAFGNLSQAEMAKRAKRSTGTISLYESGGIPLSAQAIERLAAAVGVPLWAAEGVLAPVNALVRELSNAEVAAGTDPDLAREEGAPADNAATAAVRLGIARFLAAPPDASDDGLGTGAGDEQGAGPHDPWRLLPGQELPPAAAARLREDFERLVERICDESRRAAASDAGLALDLARLALRIAQLAPGDAAARARPQAYAQAFVGNALRVADDLRAAEAAVAGAWRLWAASGDGDGSILGEWRLLDLEASLRRDQRRFAAALELVERALAAAPLAARGRILLKKAFILEQAGEIERSVAALGEARPLLDAAGEPRDRMGVRFNMLVNLCHLGRHREAEALLPELRRLVIEAGNPQDLTRLRWLVAGLAGGLGRRDEAVAGLRAALREFGERANACDAALVSLDLAVLYLEEGSPGEAAGLARDTAWILSARDLEREVAAAVRVFAEAAERQTLTADLARRLRDGLDCRRRGARRAKAPRSRPRTGPRRPRTPAKSRRG